MRMAKFLLENIESILTEWEEFARTIHSRSDDTTNLH
jgi:hypothetical protein